MASQAFTILVVDDEVTVRRSLADILRLEGYRVQTASSGEEAIQILRGQAFDLIFLDLKMPVVGGLEVMHFANANSPESQIIMLTAHGSLESAIEALRVGAKDYLIKPVSPEQIIASASKALRNLQDQKQRANLLTQIESSIQALREAQDLTRKTRLTPSGISIGKGVMINYERRVLWKDQISVQLTPLEGKLLQVFHGRPHHVFTHQELVLQVHGYQATDREAPGILRPLISRLREKLDIFPGGRSWITNIRAKGYMFDADE